MIRVGLRDTDQPVRVPQDHRLDPGRVILVADLLGRCTPRQREVCVERKRLVVAMSNALTAPCSATSANATQRTWPHYSTNGNHSSRQEPPTDD